MKSKSRTMSEIREEILALEVAANSDQVGKDSLADLRRRLSDLRHEQLVRCLDVETDLLASLIEMRDNLISHAKFGLNSEEIAMLKRADVAIANASKQG